MNTDMVLDALEQALHDRGMPKNVILKKGLPGLILRGFIPIWLNKIKPK